METPPIQPTIESKEKLKPKVLVAEDRPDITQMLTFVLKAKGCEVEVVENGRLLVLKLKEKGPNYFAFVISDNNMHGGSGIEAIAEIREKMPDFNDTTILLYTGDDPKALKVKAESYPKVSLIQKTDVRTLYDKIDALIKPKPPTV